MSIISTQVESAVLRRLKLLKRLQDMQLSPAEAQGLLERITTNRSSADDRERLAQVIRVTTQVSDQLLQEPSLPAQPSSQRLSPARQAKRKRQLAKAARRHNRR